MCDPQEQRIWSSATAYTESFETLSSKYRRRQRLRKWEEQLRATQYHYRLHDIVNVKVQWVDVLKVYYVQSIPSTMGLRRWIAIPLEWVAWCTKTSSWWTITRQAVQTVQMDKSTDCAAESGSKDTSWIWYVIMRHCVRYLLTRDWWSVIERAGSFDYSPTTQSIKVHEG